MICRKCGELLDENAKVCPVCGAGQMFGSTTQLNPSHSSSEDCAHEEAHQPRKHRKSRFRLILVPLALLFLFGLPILFSRLDQTGHNVITVIVAALPIVSFISYFRNARRK